MHWKRGFTRVRLLGTVAFVLGAVLLFSVLLTQLLGYAPDPAFAQLYGAFWAVSLLLVAIGLILWSVPWVLLGFLPDGADAPVRVPR